MSRRAWILAASVALGCATLIAGPRLVDAQTPTPTPTPPATSAQSTTVAGRVTSGTAGETAPDGLTVRLIALEGSQVTTAAQGTTKNGAYELSVPTTPGRTYVPHLTYQTVDYFGEPVAAAATPAKVQRDFVVYATTHDTPALAITSTSVTLVAIDRQAHQLGFVREDAIANPTDRVYLGDASGVTLHLPAPDGTLQAGGEGAADTFRFERGVVSVSLPIRPGAITTVVTRYLVGYDPGADTYRLRVTAPLPADQTKIRVPAGYARIRAAGGTSNAPDEQATGCATGEVLKVAQSTAGTKPGGAVLVDLVGLSGQLQSNPLTERSGAIAGAVAAFLILGGGVLASVRWRTRGVRAG